MKKLFRLMPVIIVLAVVLFLFLPSEAGLFGQNSETADAAAPESSGQLNLQGKEDAEEELPEDGSYTTKEDVSRYLILYGHLPDNFVTKAEAREAGWSGGSVEQVLPGKCIGGDRFGNYEGLLPKAKGRTWYECDIDTLGRRSRGARRILYSSDGLIYYTEDHYESYTLVYEP